ncbi:MAG: DUF4829 domain-containing protein [Caldiserica bacterium]|jgi:ketosteroid isomerase-like protein|nr:DUF4829 domain-containing protein [Caldisericota bacterium]
MSGKALLFSIITLCLIFTACSGREENASGSPSQVVESFFTALEAKDYQTAYSLQTKEFQDQMPLEIFSASIEQGLSEFQIVSQSYEIVKEEIKGDLAYVSYKIVSTTRDGKKIEGQGVYTLKREDKNWRIDLRAVTP